MKRVWDTKEVEVHKDSQEELWEYLDDLRLKSCNLYNTALTVELSHYTATQKKITGEVLTPQEQEIEDNIAKAGVHSSPSGFISHFWMIRYMRKTKNPDFLAMPSQVSAYTLKQLTDNYQNSLNCWMPPDDSMKKDERYKVIFSKQAARIKFNKETGRYFLKLPKTKLTIDLGEEPIEGTLVRVDVFASEEDPITVRLLLMDEVEDDEEE